MNNHCTEDDHDISLLDIGKKKCREYKFSKTLILSLFEDSLTNSNSRIIVSDLIKQKEGSFYIY